MSNRKMIPYVKDNLLVNYFENIVDLQSEEWKRFVSFGVSFRYEFVPFGEKVPTCINCYCRNARGSRYWYASKTVEGKSRVEYLGQNEDINQATLEYVGYVLSSEKYLYEELKEGMSRIRPRVMKKMMQIVSMRLRNLKQKIEDKRLEPFDFSLDTIAKEVDILVRLTNTN